MTFDEWLQSLPAESKYNFDSEGRGYKKSTSHMMRLAWQAATTAAFERAMGLCEEESRAAFRLEMFAESRGAKYCANAIRAEAAKENTK